MDATHSLGDFLRARRARLRPEDVGLPKTLNRRVTGLRREELAQLAGISTEYYERLEQGRDRRPSEQVLRALARALGLDDDEYAYLMNLALLRPAGRGSAGRAGQVSPGVAALMASWPLTPAFVWDGHMDVLGANGLAVALSAMFRPGNNLARSFFLDPQVRALYPQWRETAPRVTALLRNLTAAATAEQDGRLHGLIGELTARSAEFSQLWARHEVRRTTGGVKVLRHPEAGDLRLERELLELPGSDQTMIVYHAVPGSETERRLRLLASHTG